MKFSFKPRKYSCKWPSKNSNKWLCVQVKGFQRKRQGEKLPLIPKTTSNIKLWFWGYMLIGNITFPLTMMLYNTIKCEHHIQKRNEGARNHNLAKNPYIAYCNQSIVSKVTSGISCHMWWLVIIDPTSIIVFYMLNPLVSTIW